MTDRPTKDPAVIDALGRGRYELSMYGELLAFMEYRPVRWGAPRLLLAHTETNPDYGGLGLGTRLVKAALDDIRTRGGMVEALCPFVAAVIERHPEYADLVYVPEPDPELEGQQRF